MLLKLREGGHGFDGVAGESGSATQTRTTMRERGCEAPGTGLARGHAGALGQMLGRMPAPYNPPASTRVVFATAGGDVYTDPAGLIYLIRRYHDLRSNGGPVWGGPSLGVSPFEETSE